MALPLTIGPIADIAILSGLIYSALTLFRKKSPSLFPSRHLHSKGSDVGTIQVRHL